MSVVPGCQFAASALSSQQERRDRPSGTIVRYSRTPVRRADHTRNSVRRYLAAEETPQPRPRSAAPRRGGGRAGRRPWRARRSGCRRSRRSAARPGGPSCAHPDQMNAASPNTAPIITRSRGKAWSIIIDPFAPVDLPASLTRVVLGAACDVEHATAVYIEPNVWVRHRTGA